MNLTFHILPVAALLTMLCSTSLGADGPLSSDREFAKQQMLLKYDRNDNGKLDPEEIKKLAHDRLLRFDKNEDGKVDAVERREMVRQSRQMPKRTPEERKQAIEQARAKMKQLKQNTGDKAKKAK